MSEFSVLQSDSKEFVPAINKLIFDSKFNPIYSSVFDSFYEEIAGHKFKDLSLLVMQGTHPIIGLLQNIEIDSKTKPKVSHFGRSAALIANPNFTFDLIDSASQLLEDFVKNDTSNILLKNLEISGEIRINNHAILQTAFAENLIRRFAKVETRFNRIIDLNQEEGRIREDFSKSIKSALSKNLGDSQEIEIVSENSSQQMIKSAFDSLKSLHFNSAGRSTRSDQSWNIQRKFLVGGNAFIVQLLSQGNVISSAYFMITGYDCYYGVGASAPKINGISFSHLCISNAIAYSKKLGLQTFHLGEQYSYLSHEITDKESNIEKFKSFFGGRLLLEVLLLK